MKVYLAIFITLVFSTTLVSTENLMFATVITNTFIIHEPYIDISNPYSTVTYSIEPYSSLNLITYEYLITDRHKANELWEILKKTELYENEYIKKNEFFITFYHGFNPNDTNKSRKHDGDYYTVNSDVSYSFITKPNDNFYNKIPFNTIEAKGEILD